MAPTAAAFTSSTKRPRRRSGRSATVASSTEFAGGAGEELERLDAEQLGETMVRLARSPERRHDLSLLGLQRSQAFSWERAASETVKVYRKALSGEAPAPAPVRAAWDGWAP